MREDVKTMNLTWWGAADVIWPCMPVTVINDAQKLQAIDSSEAPCTSDQDASSELCGKAFDMHHEEPVPCGTTL